MLGAALQIIGAALVVLAAALVSWTLGAFIAGVALLVFGTLEELR
jgi:hypothetical protein